VKSSINIAEECADAACAAVSCAEILAGRELESMTMASDPKSKERKVLNVILNSSRHG
jgi:hypothetical protein